jgi:hypothetical protein
VVFAIVTAILLALFLAAVWYILYYKVSGKIVIALALEDFY